MKHLKTTMTRTMALALLVFLALTIQSTAFAEETSPSAATAEVVIDSPSPTVFTTPTPEEQIASLQAGIEKYKSRLAEGNVTPEEISNLNDTIKQLEQLLATYLQPMPTPEIMVDPIAIPFPCLGAYLDANGQVKNACSLTGGEIGGGSAGSEGVAPCAVDSTATTANSEVQSQEMSDTKLTACLNGVTLEDQSGQIYYALGATADGDGKVYKMATLLREAAPNVSVKQVLAFSGKHVSINGSALNLGNLKPIVKKGSTLLPARKLLESMGLAVAWNAQKKTLTASKKGYTLELKQYSKSVKVNGKSVKRMPVALTKVKGTWFVPAAYIASELGADVQRG